MREADWTSGESSYCGMQALGEDSAPQHHELSWSSLGNATPQPALATTSARVSRDLFSQGLGHEIDAPNGAYLDSNDEVLS